MAAGRKYLKNCTASSSLWSRVLHMTYYPLFGKPRIQSSIIAFSRSQLGSRIIIFDYKFIYLDTRFLLVRLPLSQKFITKYSCKLEASTGLTLSITRYYLN